MSTKSERKKQKSREKRKKTRGKAASAASAKRRASGAGRGLKNPSEWPVGDCWISSNWHEWEAVVQAILVRNHADSHLAGVVFEVNLAECTVVRASTVRDQGVQQALVRLSDGEQHLESCDPEFVAYLVREAVERSGKKPGGWGKASKMLGDIEADVGDRVVSWGYEDEEADTDESPKGEAGLVDRVKGWFGR